MAKHKPTLVITTTHELEVELFIYCTLFFSVILLNVCSIVSYNSIFFFNLHALSLERINYNGLGRCFLVIFVP